MLIRRYVDEIALPALKLFWRWEVSSGTGVLNIESSNGTLIALGLGDGVAWE